MFTLKRRSLNSLRKHKQCPGKVREKEEIAEKRVVHADDFSCSFSPSYRFTNLLSHSRACVRVCGCTSTKNEKHTKQSINS
jgi:hypothetical protein